MPASPPHDLPVTAAANKKYKQINRRPQGEDHEQAKFAA
jgi:hypothetical protein